MGQPIRHEFIAIDEGLGTLLHVDERDPARNWVVPLGHPQARDMQLVGGNRILIGHHHGFAEYELATGRVAKDVDRFVGVTSARRLPNGHTVLAGVNLFGATGVVLGELDEHDTLVHQRVLAGDYVRLIRRTSADTLLMMCNTTIRETRLDGTTEREIAVDGFLHAWKAVRLPDGRMLASAGYGAFLVEIAADGRELRRFGGKEEVPAAVRPFFYAMFQRLPTGDVVVANWQDHGPGHGSSGVQLLQFSAAGALVWQWSDAAMISSLQGLVVLDGLDTSRLHDERDGVMAPLE